MTEDAKTAPDISAENVARMTEGLTPAPLVYGIANSRFIDWAREAVPAMAEALKAAEDEIRKLRDALKFYADDCYANNPESCDGGVLCCKTARNALGLAPGVDLKASEASDE